MVPKEETLDVNISRSFQMLANTCYYPYYSELSARWSYNEIMRAESGISAFLCLPNNFPGKHSVTPYISKTIHTRVAFLTHILLMQQAEYKGNIVYVLRYKTSSCSPSYPCFLIFFWFQVKSKSITQELTQALQLQPQKCWQWKVQGKQNKTKPTNPIEEYSKEFWGNRWTSEVVPVWMRAQEIEVLQRQCYTPVCNRCYLYRHSTLKYLSENLQKANLTLEDSYW